VNAPTRRALEEGESRTHDIDASAPAPKAKDTSAKEDAPDSGRHAPKKRVMGPRRKADANDN